MWPQAVAGPAQAQFEDFLLTFTGTTAAVTC
jgi:hypothetical protein